MPWYCASPAAFSLIELLTVMTLFGLLLGLAMPAFNNIVEAGRIPSAASQIAGVLEFARNEAMTRQTYVWVGFCNDTAASQNRELCAAAFGSDDGTAKGNKFRLSRVFKIPNVMLTDFDALQAGTRNLVSQDLAATTDSVGANTRQPSSSLKAGAITFDRVLTFSPRGEVLLEPQPIWDTAFSRTVDVSLRATRGKNDPLPEADDAVVLTGGASGKIEIIYLR